VADNCLDASSGRIKQSPTSLVSIVILLAAKPFLMYIARALGVESIYRRSVLLLVHLDPLEGPPSLPYERITVRRHMPHVAMVTYMEGALRQEKHRC
jgi:hypothetical protein